MKKLISFKRKVINGSKIGKKHIFPTANFSHKNLNLPYGVYLCKYLDNKKKIWGVMHFGPKTSFDGKITLEIHFLNFEKNLYGQTLKIIVLKKIRNIKRFRTIQLLKNQIKKDIAIAYSLIQSTRKENATKI